MMKEFNNQLSRKVQLGKTGLQVSKLGLGTVQFGLDYGFTLKKTQEEVDLLLNMASRKGVNLIDTASEYGDSEVKIGNYLRNNDHDFLVATKLAKIPQEKINNPSAIRDHVESSVYKSLSNLNMSQLPLLQLHQTDEVLLKNELFWAIILHLKSKGVIRTFGVSVYEVNETAWLMDNYHTVIDFFQIPYNIFDRRFDILKSTFSRFDMGIISRSVFLKGMIPCSIQQVPASLKRIIPYKERLNSLAANMGMTSEILAIKYVCCNPMIHSTIVGVNTPAELEKNLQSIIQPEAFNFASNEFISLSIEDQGITDPRRWNF